MNARHTRQAAGRWVVRAVVAAVLSAALIGPAGPTIAATMDAVVVRQVADSQTNVGGGVTVKVSRLEAADTIVFKVVLDTHSVNLDSYDLGQLAVLRTSSGEEIAPLSWQAPPGGHHREGTLSFLVVTGDGSQVIQPDAGPLLLVIRDIAGVAERTFSWAA